ncbi:MFS transporter [Amycolatopsis endophytica]|uniref:MFS family permease n=1 Tax=Amycolatopsis endophytica TaxID=860233 RepID=A0A853BEA7_9PSEU|nr:MFS transporter [Amycolatopsis endophytica]NYI92991.1 MFS family permease [Amycolatopsis endophytica]
MANRTKWTVLASCFLAYTFDAVELVALTVALPTIRSDLHLTAVQGGWLATATLLGIGFSSLSAGWFADNHGRKTALLTSLLVFGVFTALLAVPGGFWLLLTLRFVAGFGLGGVWSAVSTLVVEAWPEHQRARAVAFVIAAFPVGGVIASLAGSLLLPDWRLMFLVLGAAVLVPVLVVAVTIEESTSWLAQRRTGAGERSRSVTIKEIFAPELRKSTVLGTVVVALAQVGFWGVSTWLPTFLTGRGLDIKLVALLVAANNAAMFVGYNVFGYVADRIGRKVTIMLTLLASALILPVYVLTTSHSVLVWIGPLFAFLASFGALFGAYLGGLFPTRVRASGAGFCFNVGRGVSAFAPLALGGLAAGYGLSSGLIVCAGFFVLSALGMIPLPRLEAAGAADRAVAASPDTVSG